MIPASVDYKRATSVLDALTLLNDTPDAKILAGGHSLIPAMKLRLNQPSVLIDIARIKDLNFIKDRGKYFAIGAATTHGAIESHQSLKVKVPLIGSSASQIGDVQVRNKGTIGGSIAHADPASDWPAVLIAANATIVMTSVKGERSVSAEDFFVGFFTTALQEGELVTEIQIPDPTSSAAPNGWRASYEKFSQPASRFAIVGCAVNLQMTDDGTIEQAFVAFNGVSDHAYRAKAVEAALVGNKLSDALAAEAAKAATEGSSMIMGDHYADETYRAHLAQVICKRAISACQYD